MAVLLAALRFDSADAGERVAIAGLRIGGAESAGVEADLEMPDTLGFLRRDYPVLKGAIRDSDMGLETFGERGGFKYDPKIQATRQGDLLVSRMRCVFV